MLRKVLNVFFVILPISVSANQYDRIFLRGEAMADTVFAMDKVVDCGEYTFALSDLDGYRYFADANQMVSLEGYRHDLKSHAYLFNTVEDGRVVHHKIIIDWPQSENYGLWYTEKSINGKNRVSKAKCLVEKYVRESLRDDHPRKD